MFVCCFDFRCGKSLTIKTYSCNLLYDAAGVSLKFVAMLTRTFCFVRKLRVVSSVNSLSAHNQLENVSIAEPLQNRQDAQNP